MNVAALLLAAALGSAWAAPSSPVSPEALALPLTITDLALSPDGCRLAFAADLTGVQELWSTRVCDSSGALRAEPGWPEQWSNLLEQVTELRYAPDGARVLFASDYGGDERRDLFLAGPGGVEPVRVSTAAETDPDAEGGMAFSPDGRTLAYTADGDRPFLFELFTLDLDTRVPRRLTREPVSVRRPAWSPDGKTIAVTRSRDGQQGELLLVDAGTGKYTVVPPLVPGGIVLAVEYAPDGKEILCLTHNALGFKQLALVPAAGGPPRLIGTGEWDVEAARYHPRAGIVFVRNEDGRSALYRMAGPEAAPQQLLPPAGRIAGFDLDASGRRLAYLWGDFAQPADAWLLDLKTGKTVRATRAAGGLDTGRLARAELIAYPASDGLTISAFYLPPASDRLGTPPPLVVQPHGGPDLQTFDEFDPLLQALSQAGFAVLAPNYRGSSGYGKSFLDINNMDWGGKDLEDLADGVRFLAASGRADARRAGITGGSYGGYLTLMALAKATETWSAGVELYGMPDLVLDFDLSGDRFIDWYKTEMGTPKTHPQLFHDRSAINFLDRIRAPLLIFQGANDTNVPPAESNLIYQKLLERKVPVGLIVYPDEGHGFSRRANRTDFYRRTVDFFVSRLGGRETAPGPKP